jgi:hypothetical protein
MELYTQQEYGDENLLGVYREDFERWTKETFLKGDKHLVRIFRDYLRSWVVYIPKNSDSISKSLAETLHEKTARDLATGGTRGTGYVMGLVASPGTATLSDNFSNIPGLGVGTYSWKECYTNATGTGTSVTATPAAYELVIFKIAES